MAKSKPFETALYMFFYLASTYLKDIALIAVPLSSNSFDGFYVHNPYKEE